MSEFHSIDTRRAARPHQCEECEAQIARGERYARYFGVQEGFFYSAIICLRCHTMRTEGWKGFDWDDENVPVFGELRNGIRYELDGGDPEAWLDERLRTQAAAAEASQRLTTAASAYQGGIV